VGPRAWEKLFNQTVVFSFLLLFLANSVINRNLPAASLGGATYMSTSRLAVRASKVLSAPVDGLGALGRQIAFHGNVYRWTFRAIRRYKEGGSAADC